ncbi:YopX family protein [Lacticaseibacillus paracasei]|uniref:YopX family protein n=1 Tax=Lacticaseibacillus paracasei TaxID=1597 RepID=UPI0023601C7F|nr:YopX family protein [Lacticaseibacillus paracasei]
MKREIKFRAYSSHNHKMYPVSNIEWDIDGRIWVTADDGKNGIELIDEEAHLMPYTGLHDKNGRKIYEGDIVSFGSVWNNGDNEDIDEEFHIGVVEYDPHDAVYNVNCEESGEHRFLFTEVVNYDGFGVIGNIFENPELLEGKQ